MCDALKKIKSQEKKAKIVSHKSVYSTPIYFCPILCLLAYSFGVVCYLLLASYTVIEKGTYQTYKTMIYINLIKSQVLPYHTNVRTHKHTHIKRFNEALVLVFYANNFFFLLLSHAALRKRVYLFLRII